MRPLDRAARDLAVHGAVWLLFGWRWTAATFAAHWAWNLWRSKPRASP